MYIALAANDLFILMSGPLGHRASWTCSSMLTPFNYPLPKPEDLFARLAGGKTFSILDISQTYLQIELDKESRKFVAINTKAFFSSPGYAMVFLPLQVHSNEPWKHCCKIFRL